MSRRRICAAAGGKAYFVSAEASEKASTEKLLATVLQRSGRADILVNGAGVNSATPFFDIPEDEFDRILAVNLKGVLYGCQAAGRVMVEQGAGSIINMASAAVLAPSPGIGPYAICKAGVAQLTQSMAVEVGRQARQSGDEL